MTLFSLGKRIREFNILSFSIVSSIVYMICDQQLTDRSAFANLSQVFTRNSQNKRRSVYEALNLIDLSTVFS